MDVQINNKSIPKDIKEMIKDPTLTVFPNLRLLIQIALTLPVTSNGSELPWAMKDYQTCPEWLPTLIKLHQSLTRKSLTNLTKIIPGNWNSTLKAEICIFV